MGKKIINVGFLGFGTVGSGTYRVLTENADLIEKRTGVRINVTKALISDESKDRGDAKGVEFTTEASDILKDKDIHIVAEMLGGIEPATEYMLKALKHGKHVVSANKAALAANLEALIKKSEKESLMLRYEAAVCGAIPVMNAVSTALSANRFLKIQGILNGTTNYILTKMDEQDAAYADVLKDAQEKGFAEADPTADVEGLDAANKLTLLIATAFGIYASPASFPVEGISRISPDDIARAREEGCKIKLIASAEFIGGKLAASVGPKFVPSDNPLSSVRLEDNAVLISGDMSGDIFLRGKGAGANPTGSAVAGDIVEVAHAIANKFSDSARPTAKLFE